MRRSMSLQVYESTGMKRFFIILIVMTICSGVWAQQKDAAILILSRNRLGDATVVDSSNVRIYYALNADSLNNQDTYVDLRVLEVGRRVTKCSSQFVSEGEEHQKEVLKTWRNIHPNADGVPRPHPIHGKRADYWNEIQYTDIYIEGQTATEYHTMPHGFQGENGCVVEHYPSQDWTLGHETATILGHQCQSATCHWHGRDFVAWFAFDIPIRHGPWKFGGLPGLILKVQDVDGFYTFEAVAIKREKEPIIRYAYDGYRKTNRDRYLRLNRELNEEYKNLIGRMGGMMMNADGEMVPASGPKKHYEPLELE